MKEYSLETLAELTNSQLIGSSTHLVSNVADLESASSDDVSFLANPHYEKAMHQSKAGAVFVSPHIKLPSNRNFLVHAEPSIAFQMAVKIFHGEKHIYTSFSGIHPTAVIHPTASLADNVTIGPYAVIDQYASIGSRSTISAHCFIGPAVKLGEDCLIHSHVTIREQCTLGNRVILQPGVVIGSCGFGYTQNKLGHHAKLEQLGSVEIGDDVEVGANTTIDRARFKTTKIGRGTKIDNLVQIAHGVEMGEHCLIISQAGIAGSTILGNHVILAGQVGVAGHLHLADGVIIAARSGVSKSIAKPGKYGGQPVLPLKEHNQLSVKTRNLETYIQKIEELEKKLNQLINHSN